MFWFILFNFSILPAAIAGIVRQRVLGREWYPFLALLWLGLCNEALSLVLIYTVRNNTINGNMYTLIEYLLILYQFYYWNRGGKTKYALLAIMGTMIWLTDNLILHSLRQDNSLFRAFYGFILVFLAIEQINMRIINSNIRLRNDAVFIVCCGFVLYFSCRAFMEVFDVFGVSFSDAFEANLFLAMAAVNCIANLTYTTALLCIPVKQRYSWPS